MEKIIMIKYGELTTKSGNRNTFIKLLKNNIINKLSEKVNIKYDRVRMFIEVIEGKMEDVVLKLQQVFGIHSIVICYKVNTNNEEIQTNVLKLLNELQLDEYRTFKVITNRANKKFEIPSMEYNNIIGTLVLKNTKLKVDVHKPELVINIEIREEFSYIYFNEIKGIGGYPVGIQGKGMLMLSGGIDSPVAGYLSMKRGINIEGIYFESPPHTSLEAKNKVIKLAKILNDYSGNVKLIIIPFTKMQEEIYKHVSDSYIITIMRRMMYRIAEKLMVIRGGKVIINGESIGQVASQTLESMSVINNVTNIPVIRPVACFDKLEIINLATKIGTYETSILPFEDCCTIFLPKNPVIKPTLDKCLLYESTFDYNKIIDEIIDNIEIIENFKEDTNNLL